MTRGTDSPLADPVPAQVNKTTMFFLFSTMQRIPTIQKILLEIFSHLKVGVSVVRGKRTVHINNNLRELLSVAWRRETVGPSLAVQPATSAQGPDPKTGQPHRKALPGSQAWAAHLGLSWSSGLSRSSSRVTQAGHRTLLGPRFSHPSGDRGDWHVNPRHIEPQQRHSLGRTPPILPTTC